MNNKLKLSSLCLCFLLTPLAFAKSIPTACPSVASIQSIGVDHAEYSMYGWAAWHSNSQYDTKESWSFVMLGMEAQNAEEAISIANANIGSFSVIEGPIKSSDGKEMWGCSYVDSNDNSHYFGAAITPPVEGLPEIAVQYRR